MNRYATGKEISSSGDSATLTIEMFIQADDEFVWDALDRALERLEEGLPLAVDELLEGREHLRARIEEMIRLAVRVRPPQPHLPEIAGYCVLRELGRGGMGTVYLARQLRVAGRAVALKVLHAGSGMGEDARRRFAAEIHAISRVRHPHIVAIHDVVEAGALLAYAMEWVDGTTLAELISDEGNQSHGATKPRSHEGTERSGRTTVSNVPFVCRIGIAIARALSAVHAAGLVHRDVKPSNILLPSDANLGPLLSDFGLVRETDSTLTQVGQFAGTPAYASPEQLCGDAKHLDPRSDVYSLGVTLYHALALRLPYSGRNPDELLRKIERGAHTPLRRANPRVPADLQTIVEKCMEADAVRRYQTAAELADDLERLLNLQPIKARPAGVVTRTLKLARRKRGTLLAAGIGGSLAAGLLVAIGVYLFLLPQWAAARVREARLALLDPYQANSVISAAWFGSTSAPRLEQLQAQRQLLDRAVRAYDAALRLQPFDAAIRAERDVVAGVVTASDEATKRRSEEGDASGSDIDLRLLGLRAYLSHDYEGAIAAWTAWEQTRDAAGTHDPLVEGALGVLYLAYDQPGRAYPRLRDACQAFPNVGFLTTYLADAAVRCKDLAAAERLLGAAASMPQQDPYGGADRVRADLLAAQGRDAEAEALYQTNPHVRDQNGPAALHYARFLASRGRADAALEFYARLVQRLSENRVISAEYRQIMDRWWSELSHAQRLERIRAALNEKPHDPESLVVRMRMYAAATQSSRREATKPRSHEAAKGRLPVFPSWLRGSVASWLSLNIFPTLFGTLQSPSLQSLSLSELATRMEVEEMSLWNRLSSYPRIFKELHFAAWRWPVMRGVAGGLNQLYSARSKQAGHVRKHAPRRAVALGFSLAAAGLGVAQTPLVEFLFDEGAGVSAASTGSIGVIGTLENGTAWSADTDSGAGFSIQFDGSDDRVTVPNSFTYGSAITVEAWIKPDDVSGFHVVWDDYGEPGVLLAVIGGGLQWNVSTDQHPGGGITIYGGAVVANEWQHVAGTYDGTTTRAYINGCLVGSKLSSGGIIDNVNGFPTGIGSDNAPNPPALLFDGRIDELRVFSGALPVQQLAEGAFGANPPCFLGLGDLPGGAADSRAYAVSTDGSTVAGISKSPNSGTGYEAFRWRVSEGMIALGDLPGLAFESSAYGLSQDGEIIVGRSESGDSSCSGNFRAFSWTVGSGMTNLGGQDCSYGGAISDDGTRIAGWTGSALYSAAYWSNGSWTSIGGTVGAHKHAHDMSRNGEWIVGSEWFNGEPQYARAFRWSSESGYQVMGELPGGSQFGEPEGVSNDGTVVGQSASALGPEAFLWTSQAGFQPLGDLPGGTFESMAAEISAGGERIVGWGTSANGEEAVLWDENLAMHRLSDVLASAGVSIPSGWALQRAYEITINENVATIVGYGVNPQGDTEAWIARFTLKPPALLGDMNCDGVVTVSDIGGFVLALTNPAGYAAQFPNCNIDNADMNQDDNVSVSDIGPFVAALTGG